MKSIRIGKTIKVKWKISTNGESVSLVGRDIVVYLISPFNVKTKIDIEIRDVNVIYMTLQGKDLTKTGVYQLVCYENEGKSLQNVVDTDAFKLVGRTRDESR